MITPLGIAGKIIPKMRKPTRSRGPITVCLPANATLASIFEGLEIITAIAREDKSKRSAKVINTCFLRINKFLYMIIQHIDKFWHHS